MLLLEELWAGYPNRTVLQGVHLELPPGQLAVLLGPNGAGKTTLVRVITGVLRPQRGRVLWQNIELHALSERRRARLVAVVPQNTLLPPGFTVYQTVLMGRTPYLNWLGRPRTQDHQAVHQALERTRLLPLAHRSVQHLSGGERQRVLLARALAQATPFLILDEPIAYLDLKYQLAILELLHQLAHDEGKAVLAVLHDLNLAARFADQVVLLHQGRVYAQGRPDEVLRPSILQRVYGVRVQVFQWQGRPVLLPWKALDLAAPQKDERPWKNPLRPHEGKGKP